MQYQEIGPNSYILRFEVGEEVLSMLAAWCKAETVTFAIFHGIGAARAVELSSYNLESKQYETQVFPDSMEIATLSGNISQVDNIPFCHAHAVIGNHDLQSYAGHLHAATVSGTVELYIETFPVSIARRSDEKTGLKLLELDNKMIE